LFGPISSAFDNPDHRIMKKIVGLFFIAGQFLGASCNTEPKKIEYGSNDGKRVSVLNRKIYYEEYGQGIPLVLLSGGGISRSINDFEKCIPDLSHHFRVIAPDTPGQGRSEQIDNMSYETLTDYLSHFIDVLKLDSAYVMGWSDGGIVGLLLAGERPDKIKKVLAVGANNGLKGAIPPTIDINIVKPLPMDDWEKNNKEIIEKYMKTLPRDWKKLVNDLNTMWYQHEDYFSKSVYDSIKVPVMIVLGDRDQITTEHGLEMHRLIKGSEFCVLPNTSHEVFAERPDLINKIAIDFFNK
jgi:pimeloyl-ACP methyl ester carboxylesterase